MSNQQIATKQQADTVRGALEKLKPQLAMALPKHLSSDRLLRVTMTAVQTNPKLLECDRTSLYAAVLTCAQLGLEPDGVLGQAYLVPFKSRGAMKVQFIPGYKGYLQLARNSGEISSIQAHEVCQNDLFSYEYGLSEHLRHKPAEGDRGEITHFYAYAKFKDGAHVFEVMTRSEVDKIRDDSEGYKAFKAGFIKSTPWESHYPQMGRKTAIRRLANYLPLSVQRAAVLDAAYEGGKHAHTDDYGDVVIDAESNVAEAEPTETPSAATSKMDALAGEDTPEEPPKERTKARTKARNAKAKPTEESESPRFVISDEDGLDVIDQQTGEIVPDEFIKRFEDGTFSVLRSYQDRPRQQPAEASDAGLFGAEG